MIIHAMASEEYLDVNKSIKELTIGNIGNYTTVRAEHAIKVRLTGNIGADVCLFLGVNSCLTIEKTVKRVGQGFKVEIPGPKAEISCRVNLPSDARVIPTPS